MGMDDMKRCEKKSKWAQTFLGRMLGGKKGQEGVNFGVGVGGGFLVGVMMWQKQKLIKIVFMGLGNPNKNRWEGSCKWGELWEKFKNRVGVGFVLYYFQKLQFYLTSYSCASQNKFGILQYMKLGDAVQPPEEKPMDPHLVLDKLLRLDRKHTNFDFIDPARSVQFRVQYPPPPQDSPPNEHLLRQFWRQAHNYYFREPDADEINRLDYFSLLLNSELSHELPFRAPQQFWKSLEEVFSPEYLQRQYQAMEKNLNAKNWLCSLYLYYRLLENQDGKPQKRIEKEVRELNSIRDRLQPQSNPRRHYDSIRIQSDSLQKMLPRINQDYDEVTFQIHRFEEELEANHSTTQRLFQQLQHRISQEEQQKRPIYCFGEEEYETDEMVDVDENELIFKKINRVDLQLNFLEQTINKLEIKQVAQSISKISRLEKTRGQIKFHISFQEAMNIKRKVLSEKEMEGLNKIRQYCLFKFYNTSLKTPYSFICQNFLGFRDIYLNRLEPCKFKNKSIMDEMKKSGHEPAEVTKNFEKFDICHHCKLLYPENVLVKCKYTSERMGVPIQPAQYCDPYLIQISKFETAKSQRYMGRRRNCLQNYTKVGEEYVCNRKFCKYCLKQNYEEGLDKNGLCPFCQGICFCTRCGRNDTIVRLKSIFLLMGGDMSTFKNDKFLQIENNEDEEEEETKSIRKKGRPKKVCRRPVSAPNKAYERMNAIRMQMEHLRLLCDMVKKREKTKVRCLEASQQFFYEKINMLSHDFSLVGPSHREMTKMSNGLETEEMENLDLDQIRKRHHRLI